MFARSTSNWLVAALTLTFFDSVDISSAQAVSQPYPCLRWAHQSTVAHGQSAISAIWTYGGRARTSIGQAADTWTNALLKLDVSQGWDIAEAPIMVVKSDSNKSTAPPKVGLGMLWTSSDATQLYQAFGQYSDTPPARPTSNDVWVYDIPSSQWSILPTTNKINSLAEAAAAVVPSVGSGGSQKAFYFGGHVDEWTQANYEGQRAYLSSLASFDVGVKTWSNTTLFAASGDSGSRNSSSINTPPLRRADATFTYVPNLGTGNKGVLVSIGGGNSDQMIDNSVLDVYDIGSNAFVKQATQGTIMGPRMKHCAVRGSVVVNGREHHQIYVYGGQAANETIEQAEGPNSDLYILSLPSYTWTFVGSNITGSPTGRAGHTCQLIGEQLVSIGGYIDESVLCEQPAIYVLNTTSLGWSTSFTPNTQYSVPVILQGLLGGTGSSNSTGGNGWQSPNNDYTAAITATGGNTAAPTGYPSPVVQNPDSRVRVGSIIGGVLGGLCALAIVLLMARFMAKRKRRQETAAWRGRKGHFNWATGKRSAAHDADQSSVAATGYPAHGGNERMHSMPMKPTAVRMSSHRPSDSWDSQHSSDSMTPYARGTAETDARGIH